MLTPAQITEIQKTQLDALDAYGQALLNGAERLTQLHLSVSRAFLRDAVDAVQNLAATKDPREWINVAQANAQPTAEELVNYTRSLYSIASGIGTELSQIAQAQLGECNRSAAALIDVAAKSAPAGSESAVAWMKNAVAAGNTAFDSINKATRQAVDATGSNLAVVAAAAESTMKPRTRKQAAAG